MTGDAVELNDMRDGPEDVNPSEPLIHEDESCNERAGADGEYDVQLRTAGKAIWLLTFSAGMSGLLFGYDTGVISSTLVSIGPDLSNRSLTTADKSLITAITSLIALFAAPTTGYLADQYGRRSVILLASILFTFGAMIQAAAGSVPMMVLGRAIVGAAVGLASCATPLYITELAPAQLRGRLVTVQSLLITGGQVIAYLVGWRCAYFPSGWRWMVGLGAVPALIQLLLLASMPETPRWLIKAGQETKARAVLYKVYGGLPDHQRQATVDRVLTSIKSEVAEEYKLADADLDPHASGGQTIPSAAKSLYSNAGNRRALTIACTLQALQQLCGFNSLMYFSATIFAMVGFTSPIETSLSVAITNFLFTVVAFGYIDIIGRRNILLWSMPFMVIGLLICSVAFHIIDVPRSSEGPFVADGHSYSAWSILLLLSMILYVAAYAIGLGCVPWQQSELFPLRVRSLGSGISTATNWSSNFLIGITFLPLMEALGASATFVLYGMICVFGWFVIWKIYPETAGLELEGIGRLLRDGWGVQTSIELFRSIAKQHSVSLRDDQVGIAD